MGNPQDPRLSYFLCSTPRSGSWLLAEALRDTGIAGNPSEYFAHVRQIGRPGPSATEGDCDFDEFLRQVTRAATTPNGVLGIKFHLDQFEHLMCSLLLRRSGLAPGRLRGVLDAAFPGLRFVWLIRRDKVQQALSWWRALKDDIWFRYGDEPSTPDGSVSLDFERVHRLHQILLSQHSIWAGYFEALGITPIVVEYENLAGSYAATVAEVLRRLGIAGSGAARIPSPRLRKMAGDASNEWASAYRSWLENREERVDC